MSQIVEFLEERFCVITLIRFALVFLILRDSHDNLLGNEVTYLIIKIVSHSDKMFPYQIIQHRLVLKNTHSTTVEYLCNIRQICLTRACASL